MGEIIRKGKHEMVIFSISDFEKNIFELLKN